MTVKHKCQLSTSTQSSNWAFHELWVRGLMPSLIMGYVSDGILVYVDFIDDTNLKHELKACFTPSHLRGSALRLAAC
jgi:hypothetical protein